MEHGAQGRARTEPFGYNSGPLESPRSYRRRRLVKRKAIPPASLELLLFPASDTE